MEDDNDKLTDEVQRLLADGRKIDAIKRYREVTGAGLAEAKEAVEAIQQGEPFPSTRPADSGLETEIVSLLGRGQKIKAVKVYREHTGTGLKEAKEAVEAIGQKHRISTPAGSGCLGVVVLLAVIVAGMTTAIATSNLWSFGK